jgi:DNA-nicking Smr family endonuclease
MTFGHRGKPLSPAEDALWQRVIATVTPLHKVRPKALPEPPSNGAMQPKEQTSRAVSIARRPEMGKAKTPATPTVISHNLDGHWDRKFLRGRIEPDLTIDLHGHSLASAYGRLDAALDHARHGGVRVILLITGKAKPDRPHGPDGGRGAIRAAVEGWISASRHARHIAAVRNAHPRHGGTGAIYIVLKRGI